MLKGFGYSCGTCFMLIGLIITDIVLMCALSIPYGLAITFECDSGLICDILIFVNVYCDILIF